MNFKELFKKTDKKNMSIIYLIFLLGICLMTIDFPQKSTVKEESVQNTPTEALEEKMEDIFSQIQGVGNVRVLINYKSGKETIPAKDTSYSTQNSGTDTSTSEKIVFSSGSQPVVLKEKNPEIQGIIIVAQGGDNIQIKNQLIRSSQALLGIDVNKIEVLKMKS